MYDTFICAGCRAVFHDERQWELHTEDCADYDKFWAEFDKGEPKL